ncbi:MAG: hypothetical protein NUW37_13280 [Planctomycetes bacterium]|nr:hypothetical protein [Planctomycetota bacterium]
MGFSFLGPVIPPALAIVIIAALFGFSFFGFRKLARALPLRRFAALAILRSVFLALVLALLFQPAVTTSDAPKNSLGLTVFIDASQSMLETDSVSRTPRINMAEKIVFDSNSGLVATAIDTFDVRTKIFADSVTDVTGELRDYSREGFRLIASGGSTEIHAALEPLGEPGGKTVAAVLLTDGATTSDDEALAAARKAGVPVFVIGIGRAGAADADARVLNVECERSVYLGLEAKVRAEVEFTGFSADEMRAEAKVELLLRGEVLDEKTFVPGNVSRHSVELTHRPENAGNFDFEVCVTPGPSGERRTENNTQTVSVSVIKEKLRVLYIEGRLSPEYNRFQRYLKADEPDMEYTILIRKGAGNEYELQSAVEDGVRSIDLDPEKLAKYDAIVLGDISPDMFSESSLSALHDFVSTRGGGVIFKGALSFLENLSSDSVISKLLPVDLATVEGEILSPFVMRVTPDGARHPVLSGYADVLDERFSGFDAAKRAKPGSVVLGTSDGARSTEYVVLSCQEYGSGRTLLLNASPTYTWYRPIEEGRKSAFHRFWGQAIRYVARKDDSATYHSAFSVDRRGVLPGESVNVVFDPSAAGASAEGPFEALSMDSRTVLGRSEDSSVFEGSIRTGKEGLQYLTLEVIDEKGDAIGFSRTVRVGKSQFESSNYRLAESLLNEIAGETGGLYASELEAGRIADALLRLSASLTKPVTHNLLESWEYFVVIILFLGLEWILRRRFALI